MADYFFKDHKPSAMECKARLRGLWRIISSKTISPCWGRASPAGWINPSPPGIWQG